MSPRLSLFPFLPLAFAFATAAAAGCSGLGIAADTTSGKTGGDSADAGPSSPSPPAGSSGVSGSDGGKAVPPAPDYLSNPLCAAKLTTCNPQLDNSGMQGATTANDQCHSLLDRDAGSGDAGTPYDSGASDASADADVRGADGGGDSDGGNATYACHVTKTGSGVSPVCLSEGTSTGTCLDSESCVAGSECIASGGQGSGSMLGQCRRYCCESSACDSSTFCDVQSPLHMADVMVPVCMPVVHCNLLSTDSCPGQTCGIALDAKGAEITTCIDVGPRKEGEDCETDHCGAGLACLGAQGSRTCFKLCSTQNPSCPSGERCRTNGVTFNGTNVGVCGP